MRKKAVSVLGVLLVLVLAGCAPKLSPRQSLKPEARDDFGCWPPDCSSISNDYGRQLCVDWKAGKNVTWFKCSYATTDACKKLCEFEIAKNPPRPAMPSNISSMPSSMPAMPSSMSPADFIFHPRDPACVPATDYHAQLVYARPSDQPDRYDAIAKKLRIWLRSANGLVNTEASRSGVTADFRVACDNGQPAVLDVALPRTASEYNTHDGETRLALVADLKKAGYGDTKTKYIVYYDGNADGCGNSNSVCSGQIVTRGVDDRLSADNLYNSGPDYAVLYDVGFTQLPQQYHADLDMVAPIGMLHEFSHTLGAVQGSAPHSSKDETSEPGHCNDEPDIQQGGNDVMCKSDKPDTAFEDACKESGFAFRYDCNNDDYFNPKPAPGSYLATHWNLGSPLNHFITFGTP